MTAQRGDLVEDGTRGEVELRPAEQARGHEQRRGRRCGNRSRPSPRAATCRRRARARSRSPPPPRRPRRRTRPPGRAPSRRGRPRARSARRAGRRSRRPRRRARSPAPRRRRRASGRGRRRGRGRRPRRSAPRRRRDHTAAPTPTGRAPPVPGVARPPRHRHPGGRWASAAPSRPARSGPERAGPAWPTCTESARRAPRRRPAPARAVPVPDLCSGPRGARRAWTGTTRGRGPGPRPCRGSAPPRSRRSSRPGRWPAPPGHRSTPGRRGARRRPSRARDEVVARRDVHPPDLLDLVRPNVADVRLAHGGIIRSRVPTTAYGASRRADCGKSNENTLTR